MFHNNRSISIINGLAMSILIACLILVGLKLATHQLKLLMLLMFFLYGGLILFSVSLAKRNGEQGFQKIFEAGYRTVLIGLLGLFLFIFIGNKINPSYKEKQLNEMKENLIAQKWSDEKITQQINTYSKNFVAIKSGQMFMLLLPSGLLFAALGAFAMSRKNRISK